MFTAANAKQTFQGLPPDRDDIPMIKVGELSQHIGHKFVGDWFNVEVNKNDDFCHSTYLDLVYGAESDGVYQGGLIEGFYLLSLSDAFRSRVFKDDPGYYALNYGGNKLRFIEQVTFRDDIRFTFTLANVTQKGAAYLVEQDCELEIKGRERPAMVYNFLYYLLPVPEKK